MLTICKDMLLDGVFHQFDWRSKIDTAPPLGAKLRGLLGSSSVCAELLLSLFIYYFLIVCRLV